MAFAGSLKGTGRNCGPFTCGNVDITIRTETSACIAGFKDDDKGIDIEPQCVMDVDYYHPRL